ncbi:MAG: hypothetical protein VX061_05490 [Pseudomonadota bacterium]|nr:hypothetical protein [Pseudomonadota bacterium]
MRNIMESIRAYRFDNHFLTYTVLYFLLLAPPRAFQIKINEHANGGELAKFPTYFVVAVELIVRIAVVLILAALVESSMGNTLYETYRIDVFFVSLVVVGTVHSTTFYMVFNNQPAHQVNQLTLFLYRCVRNCGYAILSGFISIIPVLIWNWDHELAPYSDGFALKVFFVTTVSMALIGIIEAKVMNRKPLGTELKHAVFSVQST